MRDDEARLSELATTSAWPARQASDRGKVRIECRRQAVRMAGLPRELQPARMPFDRCGHLVHIGHAVDPGDDPAGFVDRQDRRGLGAVFGHAGAHGCLVVVGTALEFGAAALVADAGQLGLLERVVIALAAIGAGEAPGDPLDQRVLVDLKFDHMVELAAALRRGSRRATAACAAVRG